MKRVIKKEEYEVVKHNNLINIKSKFPYTLNQLKLICHLVSNIKPTDENLKPTKVNIIDLNFEMIEKGNNYSLLKDDLLNLLQNPFQIPNDGGYTNWFSYLKYENGLIVYRFDPALKPFLLNLKGNFTEYYLSNLMNLKSNYAILTYELLSQVRKQQEEENLQGYRNITIKEYRELLKIPDSYLNADVLRLLKKVQKEIRERTNLQFNFAMKKMGKPFHSIIFVLLNNKKVAGVTYELVTKIEK